MENFETSFKEFLSNYDAYENGHVFPFAFTRWMYKLTNCGAWAQFSVDPELNDWIDGESPETPESIELSKITGIRIGTIVEGSDAEILAGYWTVQGFDTHEVNVAISEMESLAEYEWQLANSELD